MDFRRWVNHIRDIFRISFSLARVDFKIRNEGSYLGIIWYLLDPLLMFIIILVLGGVITRTDIDKYPLYLLLGLIMFNFFRQATSMAADTISRNSGFIKSVKISFESLVLSPIIQFIYPHLFEVILFIVIALVLSSSIYGIIFYPIIFFLLIIFSLGVSFILASIGAYINDLKNVWNVLMNLLWFATPIFYIIPEGKMTLLNKINPIYYFIKFGREIVIYNRAPSTILIIFVCLVSIISLIIGLIIFEKLKNKFAELV